MNRFILFLIFLLTVFNVNAKEIIPSGNEKYFLSLVGPYDTYFENFKLKNISIESDRVRYEYCDHYCFYIILTTKLNRENPFSTTHNFKIYVQGLHGNININPIIEEIKKNDIRDIFEKVSENNPINPKMIDVRFIYVFIMIFLILIVLFSFKSSSEFIARYLNLLSKMPYYIYVSLFILILFWAANLRLKGIYLPLVEEGSAIRLLNSYDSWIYNLFVSNDPRHPGLYFALLKPFVLFSKNPAYTARIFSAILSILSVAVMGLIFIEYNRLGSLFAMLLLALHPEYIYRSREITDISLFVLMSLITIYFLRKTFISDSKIYRFLFSLFLGLASLSSYAAYIVMLAILLYLLIKRRLKAYLNYLLLTFIMVIPYILKILFSLKEEFYTKSMATAFPDIIWGNTSLTQFILNSLSLLYADEYTIVLLLLFMPLLALSYKKLKSEPLFLILFLANFAFGFLSVWFRMMPYYMIFFPISFILLITEIDIKIEGATFSKVFSIVLIISTIYSFIETLENRYENTYIQSYHLRTNPALFVKKIKEIGIKNIVIDIENNKNIIGYYFFENPYKVLIKGGLKVDSNGLLYYEEEESGRRIIALTKTLKIHSGWERESIEKLNTLEMDKFHFVYDKVYPNLELLDYLSSHCSYIYLGEKYIVFECKRLRNKIH